MSSLAGTTCSSWPPLAQVTQIKTDLVCFMVLLEIDQEDAAQPWEAAVWYAWREVEIWVEKPLLRVPRPHAPKTIQAVDPSKARLYFAAVVAVPTALIFTIKYRKGPADQWSWVKENQGMNDGIVVFNPEVSIGREPRDFSSVMQHLNRDITVRSTRSQSPDTQLWKLAINVGAARGDNAGYTDMRLGKPWSKPFIRWSALVRQSSPWLVPRHGGTVFSIDKDAVALAFDSCDGEHLVLLGLGGFRNVTTVLRSTEDGQVSIHVRNDKEQRDVGTVLAAIGYSVESAMAAVMYEARIAMSWYSGMDDITRAEWDLVRELHPPQARTEWYGDMYDGLGYCTWNALGQDLTDEKIYHAVEALAKDNINISNIIIDDNWQDIDDDPCHAKRGLRTIEAHPEAFPKGLKETVKTIRSKHPHIQYVIVWHALLGYWGGISPHGSLVEAYNTAIVHRDTEAGSEDLGEAMTVVAREDASNFLNDFFMFLADAGIDGVKTDVQCMLDRLSSAQKRRELTDTYLDAWVVAAHRHFAGNVISCMSQTPHNIFYSQLPRDRLPMLVRNSDDFFPEEPGSHTWHVFANAHNMLLTQHLNCLPDWDMFQTNHDYSHFHAAARCVSGGPIYITDQPGSHDLALIKQMTGRTTQGKTVIFRPSVPGCTVDPYSRFKNKALLKIKSYHGRAEVGTPILATFNVLTQPLTELIPLSSFPGVLDSRDYIVRAFSSGMVSGISNPKSPSATFPVSLGVRGWDILTAYPLRNFHIESLGDVHVANLGLVDKMTGSAAIESSNLSQTENGRVLLKTKLKALGVLGIYVSALPKLSIDRDFMAGVDEHTVPRQAVSIDSADGRVLLIDLEAVWHEFQWGKEAEVKVYFEVKH